MTNPQNPPPPGQQAGYPPHPGSTTPPPQFQQPPPGYAPGPQGYGPPPGPPPKKGTSKALIALLACIGLFVAFIVLIAIVAAVAPKDTTTSPTTAAGTPGQPAAPADSGPGASKDNPAPIGTEVSPAKDWTIKVNSANLDAGAELAKKNQFNTPRVKTNKLIAVNVTIRNGSDRPQMALTAMKVGALPPSGVEVNESFAIAGADTINPSAQLQPGASVTGILVYELAPADIPQTVLLAEPQFTLDQNEDQRFLAIQ